MAWSSPKVPLLSAWSRAIASSTCGLGVTSAIETLPFFRLAREFWSDRSTRNTMLCK